jgi:hypothetical protein
VWVPGYEWGPAWVSWRFGGNYVGWAPLPPDTLTVYESRPLTGHLDVEFDIGPAYYNFVDVRYIGEPVLRTRIVPVQQNITYINETVNVTNITYKNKTVYNYGPDLNVVNQYSSRPIQKLKLERQATVSAPGAGAFTKVQGNALVVAAPRELKKPASPPPPPAVKKKIAEPKIEKGWSVAGDANAQAQLKEKIKSQSLKNVPPPTTVANAAAAAGATGSPGNSVAPGASSERGKGKKAKRAEELQAGASATPGAELTSPSASPAFPQRGKRKGKAGEQFQPGTATSPLTSPQGGTSPATEESFKPGKKAKREKFGQTPPTTGPTSRAEEFNKPRKAKGFERENVQPTPGGATSPTENFNEPRGKRRGLEQPGTTPGAATDFNEAPRGGKRRQFEQPAMSPTGPAQNTPAGPYGESRGKRRQFEEPAMSPTNPAGAGNFGEERNKRRAERLNAPSPGGPEQPMGQGQPAERKHEGGKKGGPTPTPGPQ